MTWHIHQLIDPSTAEIKYYEPGDQVHEIINATTRALESTRLALLRERLAGLEPVTTPRHETVESLAVSFFARREDNFS